MTDTEKIERLATEVMKWETKYEKDCYGYDYLMVNWLDPYYAGGSPKGWVTESGFDPLTNENHFRMVMQRVMEDEKLFTRMMEKSAEIEGAERKIEDFEDAYAVLFCFMKADLPPRVDSLLAALQSLSPDEV